MKCNVAGWRLSVLGIGFGSLGLLAVAAQEHGGAVPQQIVAYPPRPRAAQAVLDRGKANFAANCAFCHGSDAGGGTTGPNLLRSSVVLADQSGELLLPIVRGSRKEKGMPPIPIDEAQTADIAAWLHSLPIGSGTFAHEEINIVVGDRMAGELAFKARCSSCHSVSGDLKGLATRFPDPKMLQQTWLMPSTGASGALLHVPPVTATVAFPDGKTLDGKLDRIDDFSVSLTLADGTRRNIDTDNGVPKVELHDPLKPHRELLPRYTDKEIHDMTAYLVTIQ